LERFVMQQANASYLVRRAFLRIHRRIGWGGTMGVTAVIAALAFSLNMVLQPIDVAPDFKPSTPPPVTAVPPPSDAARLALPAASDLPVVLNRIRRSAEGHGLGWPRAEYRQQSATDEMPASVEVHCTLKGNYPQVRAFLTEVLLDSPSTTVRSFSVTRAASESAEVEARLVFATYFREGHP
jgi:hypothetical protein